MKPIKVKPNKRLILAFGCVLAFTFMIELGGVLNVFSGADLSFVPVLVLSALLLVTVADLALSWQPVAISVSRNIPSSLSLGKSVVVSLEIRNDLTDERMVEIRDAVPPSFRHDADLEGLSLKPGLLTRVDYGVVPRERGTWQFGRLELRVPSRLLFWSVTYADDQVFETRVYPNFAAIAGYTLLHTDNQSVQMGIKKKSRRGEGMDFLQLREYREGDSLRQIDWKASSRFQKLISQEYQDARDQQVMVMLDAGRRMRSQDGELSHFDHSLNATLLLSHIALKQGDSVSVFSFGSKETYVPPFKGAGNVKHLLNEVFDLYPSKDASDYLAAAQSVSVLNRKRSLVVLVSNLRDEDLDDLMVSVKLLQKKHLVLVANLVEEAIEDGLLEDVSDFDSALRYAGIVDYNRRVDEAMERLKTMGVWFISCRPSELSIRVVNSYLQIKNAAIL